MSRIPEWCSNISQFQGFQVQLRSGAFSPGRLWAAVA